MNKTLLIYPILIIFLFSCASRSTDEGYPVLKASLEETNTSLYDIFEKIEIIPLEALDHSLIKSISKIKYYDGIYYVLDKAMNRILFFDDNGKYLNKIDAVGNGPGEYPFVNDFNIDIANRQIEILAVLTILKYDLNGSYISSYTLPPALKIYQGIEYFGEHSYLLYVSEWPGGPPSLKMAPKDESKEVKNLYDEDFYLNCIQMADVFSRDEQGNIYFMRPFRNEVYRVTSDSLQIAYTWDFGSRTNDISSYTSNNTETDEDIINEKAVKLLRLKRNGELPNVYYSFSNHYQTNNYFYSILLLAPRGSVPKHLFYNKTTEAYSLFEKTSEGLDIGRPVIVTNDYMIAEFDYEKKESFANILKGKNKEVFDNFREDDNSCLIKYTFKK